MVNWYGVKINAEEEWLNCFILDPGWASTDMGNRAAQIWGFGEKAPGDPDESVDGMFKVLTTATKEACGGRIVSFTGEIKEW
jgi:norsolorinic acid ketoreductase